MDGGGPDGMAEGPADADDPGVAESDADETAAVDADGAESDGDGEGLVPHAARNAATPLRPTPARKLRLERTRRISDSTRSAYAVCRAQAWSVIAPVLPSMVMGSSSSGWFVGPWSTAAWSLGSKAAPWHGHSITPSAASQPTRQPSWVHTES